MIQSSSEIERSLSPSKPMVLDGGLSTLLETRGYKLDSELWSALLLLTHPEAVEAVHLDYLEAGADIITTASYQASLQGFLHRGMDRSLATKLLQSSVTRACSVRDRFWQLHAGNDHRLRPRVAASVGPYGAYLANGAEYTGNYDLDYHGLLKFHSERWRILADQQPDVMLCETIPSFLEAQALAELASRTEVPVWISFCCRDERHICDGTSLCECAAWLERNSAVQGTGVNCVSPQWASKLVEMLTSVVDLPIVIYPNSGEQYDPKTGQWTGQNAAREFAENAVAWWTQGAAVIGGCCRTTPEHIATIRELFANRPH